MQRERRCRPARSPSWARPWHEHRLSVCVPPLGTQKQLAGMLRLFQPWNWRCICCFVPPRLLLLLRAPLGSPGQRSVPPGSPLRVGSPAAGAVPGRGGRGRRGAAPAAAATASLAQRTPTCLGVKPSARAGSGAC